MLDRTDRIARARLQSSLIHHVQCLCGFVGRRELRSDERPVTIRISSFVIDSSGASSISMTQASGAQVDRGSPPAWKGPIRLAEPWSNRRHDHQLSTSRCAPSGHRMSLRRIYRWRESVQWWRATFCQFRSARWCHRRPAMARPWRWRSLPRLPR